MPRGDLVTPTDQGATERTHFGGAGFVLEVAAESVDELDRKVGITMVVDAAHDFLRVPRSADLTARVARVEEPEQLAATVVVESLVGLGQ